jgi:uroporphyrinogen-III synthase
LTSNPSTPRSTPSATEPISDPVGRDEPAPGSAAGGLDGCVVLAFESRRAQEMGNLIRRHGGVAIVAPSVREVALTDSSAAAGFVERLERGSIDAVILMTGVGVRMLVEAVSGLCLPERLARLLGRTMLVARGPKPTAELRRLGLAPDVRVPEPNTWREVLSSLEEAAPIGGRSIAILEHGAANPALTAELEARGAEVVEVPVYRWALPEDRGPLTDAVVRLADGDSDFAVFTSRTQVDHVMQISDELGLRERVLDALARHVLVASIGPVCSEALRGHGIVPDLEPEHPKMGHLVVALRDHGRRRLADKRVHPDT